ncbi:MAG TPA: exodeoxyribonuclease V subunit beta [Chitinispirillaceae bacterium]|nr:exodeoxyribonuclease V subunit beta [Chitinispirillaceae bacterium]
MNFKQFNLNKIPLSGHNLIEANAGTGKTYTISRLFLRLLLEKELPLSSILVVTFTEAATQELKERVYLLLKEAINLFSENFSTDPFFSSLLSAVDNKKGVELLQSAIHNFDTVSIYTIHGFCQRLLFEHSFESGIVFNSEVISDQSIIIKEITNDFWRLNFYDSSVQFTSYALHSGLTQKSFSDLLKFSGRSFTNLRIIPQIQDEKCSDLESAFNAKLESVKKIWFKEKELIVKLLFSGSLKAVKYKHGTIRKMISNMDLLAASEIADPLLFDRFENLTTTVLKANTKKGAVAPEHEFFDHCEELQKCAQELKIRYDERIIFLKTRYIDYVHRELKIRKEKKNQLFFDDLLLKVYDALNGDPQNCKLKQVTGRVYKAALIDEFQDTDFIQYSIFSSLFSSSTMFLIGDPKQSIYSFRGADIFTYLQAAKRVNSKYTLLTNYRCHKKLLDATNMLFGLHEKMFVFKGISFSRSMAAQVTDTQQIDNKITDGKPLKFLFIDTENKKFNIQEIRNRICSVVASHISTLLKDNDNSYRLNPQDIAILVRKNSEAEMIKTVLSDTGIHSVVDSGNSVFKSSEAVQLMRVLKAVSDPYRDETIRCALTTDLFGYNGNEIDELNSDNNESEHIAELFFRLYDLWNESGFEIMIRYFFNKLKIRSKVLSLPSGERKLTNYLHLSELLHVQEQRYNLGMSALYFWMTEKIHENSSFIPDEEIMRLESDENAVKIVTIHKSKGLEYPVVFCPFCWSGSDASNRKDEPIVFHYGDECNDTVLALGPQEIEDNRDLAEKEILAENMRLLYVALTRAKYGCYVVHGKFPYSESAALSYLLFGNDLDAVSVQNLRNHVKALPTEQIFDRLKSLELQCDSICVKKVSIDECTDIPGYKEDTVAKKLQCRQFTGSIPDAWRISSFSSLTRSHHYAEIPDYDHYEYPENKNKKLDFDNIMDFPKGAVAGNFIHHIFERIQFCDLSSAEGIISESLLLFGFDTKWFNTILKLVKDTTETILDPDSKLKLTKIPQNSCLKEVQFNFPLNQFSFDKLNKIYTNNNQPDLFRTDYSVSGLDFSLTRGYMKGFIDLIFKWGDKFFLLDWKSNFLGSSKEDYREDILFEVMKKEHYILQSHIYMVALDKFLKFRYPLYNYDQHFGGIFYLFIRGIEPDSRSGIFFSRPEKEILTQLKQILCR